MGTYYFWLIINDIPKVITDSWVLFADDTSTLTSCENNDNLNQILNYILNTIKTWMNDQNLKINLQKPKLLNLGPIKNPQ